MRLGHEPDIKESSDDGDTKKKRGLGVSASTKAARDLEKAHHETETVYNSFYPRPLKEILYIERYIW